MHTNSATYSSLPEVFASSRESKEAVHQPSEKEVFTSTQDSKEVAHQHNEKFLTHWDHHGSHKLLVQEGWNVSGPHAPHDASLKPSHGSRNRVPWICGVVILVILLGIALGVGLGLGLRDDGTHDASSAGLPDSPTDGVEPPQAIEYLSTRGAFNGTGIACGTGERFNLNDTSLPPIDYRDLLLFYQHYSGEIRWMQRLWPDTWLGGTSEEVVATDAKNGTPISMTSITMEYSEEYHVFYLDQNDLVKQRYRDNITLDWSDGPLNDLNFHALHAETVALRSALYGGTISNVNLTGVRPWTGIRIFVGTTSSTIDQLSWYKGLSQWYWEQTWQDVNGHATPATLNSQAGMTTYTMLFNLQNEVDLWWRDTSQETASTATHPINEWTKSAVTIPDIDPNMGVTYNGQLYGRNLTDASIDGWPLFLQGENSTQLTNPPLLPDPDGPKPVSRSSIFIRPIPYHAPEEHLLFYQATGNDILILTGDIASGQWTNSSVPFPRD